MAAGYTVLPLVYDRWQQSYGKDYSSLILPRLLSTLSSLDVPPSSMLDVACGTGALALLMARRGWKVQGIDASAEMVRVAREKFSARGVQGHFLVQDMREIRLPAAVRLATCMFDSLNHLPNSRDLLSTFRGVYQALEPGGYFVFDLNNERCFRTLWTRAGVSHHRDYTLVLDNQYSPRRRTACSHVTLFLRKGPVYTRHEETVCEKLFARDLVVRLLRKAGFMVVRNEDFNFTSVPSVGKIKTWYVCRRPAA